MATTAGSRLVRLVLVWTLLAAIFGTVRCHAQSVSNTVDSGELRTNPMVALRAFEPSAAEEYQLGPGDDITLDIGGRPELSGKRTIGPDGRITLPLAGSIMVADKTREKASVDILTALTPFYSNLSVTISVDKYNSNRVLLLGAVEHPGIIQFDTRPTLLEVVTRGGVLGGTSTGYGDSQVRRPVIPERCIIYRGADKVMFVDLKGLLDSGNPMADLRLRRDDIVYIPSTSDRYISVLGQVQHPGAFQLENSSTLQKLLAQAGGLTDAAGNNPSIRIISAVNGTSRVVTLNSLLQPRPVDLGLRSGDIIFVPKSNFNKISYVFDKISPLVSIFTAFAFLEQ